MRNTLSTATSMSLKTLCAAAAAMLAACGGGESANTTMALSASGAASAGASSSAAATDAGSAASDASSTDASIEKQTDKPRYSLSDLGPIGAVDMNKKGALLMLRNDGVYVQRANGKLEKVPAGCMQGAAAISDHGAIAGTNGLRAVLFRANGTCEDMGTLGGTSSSAADVNSQAQAVGWSYLAGDTVRRAFVWQHGQMHDIGTLGGAAASASAISEGGIVTGWSGTAGGTSAAYVYRNVTMTAILPPGGSAEGLAVNDSGQVAGTWRLPCQKVFCSTHVSHAFLYGNGVFKDIDTLGSELESVPHAINKDGVVVGHMTNTDEWENFRAFVYKNGKMQLLNDLLDASGAGWTLIEAYAVDDRGVILARGYRNGDWQNMATVLLEPSAKPAAR